MSGDVLNVISVVALFAPVAVWAVARWQRRSRIRITVRHLDTPAARAARHQRAVEGLDAGCRRLLAAIPQQRGGEPRVR